MNVNVSFMFPNGGTWCVLFVYSNLVRLFMKKKLAHLMLKEHEKSNWFSGKLG